MSDHHTHDDHDHSGHDHSGHDHSAHDHSAHDHSAHDHADHKHGDDLEAQAKAHIDEMPAETALGNSDTAGGGHGTPAEFEVEHEGKGGK